jgi:hypothetical protein
MPSRKKKIRKQELPGGKLYPLALELAKARSLEELYLATRLPISWLRKFRAGEIKAPSVQRVELLISAITGKKF